MIRLKAKKLFISKQLKEETRKRRIEPLPLETLGMSPWQKLWRRIKKLWKK